jgi:hypothetical protein
MEQPIFKACVHLTQWDDGSFLFRSGTMSLTSEGYHRMKKYYLRSIGSTGDVIE